MSFLSYFDCFSRCKRSAIYEEVDDWVADLQAAPLIQSFEAVLWGQLSAFLFAGLSGQVAELGFQQIGPAVGILSEKLSPYLLQELNNHHVLSQFTLLLLQQLGLGSVDTPEAALSALTADAARLSEREARLLVKDLLERLSDASPAYQASAVTAKA